MNKADKYISIMPQVEQLISDECDDIANMANVVALLHEEFRFLWTGFYRVVDNQLLLGPFQGPVACTRIQKGKGVCGTAWQQQQTIVVLDVHQFSGHIACSSLSNSEIVVPIIKNSQVVAVLDIDSREYGCFDETDKYYLEKVAEILSKRL